MAAPRPLSVYCRWFLFVIQLFHFVFRLTADVDAQPLIELDVLAGDDNGEMGVTAPQLSQLLLSKRVNLALRIVPGGNHSEASWEKQVPIFMECLGL